MTNLLIYSAYLDYMSVTWLSNFDDMGRLLLVSSGDVRRSIAASQNFVRRRRVRPFTAVVAVLMPLTRTIR